MEKLKNRSEQVKIEVNDEGEYISFNMSDKSFPMKFSAMYDDVLGRIKSLSTIAESQTDILDTKEVLKKECELSKIILGHIDDLFGTEASRKIFGDIIPDIYAIMNFFEEIIPIIQKYGKKHRDTITSKYSAKRKGKRG